MDTSVWSLSLRRKPKDLHPDEKRRVEALAELVRDGSAVMIGPIRQEVLSGIREGSVFEKLRKALRAFPDVPLVTDDYEVAARAGNVCRSAGIAGSTVDFLICAAALRRRLEIFTADNDFTHYAKHLPLRLHAPRRGVRIPLPLPSALCALCISLPAASKIASHGHATVPLYRTPLPPYLPPYKAPHLLIPLAPPINPT